jgi:hypothetical protein
LISKIFSNFIKIFKLNSIQVVLNILLKIDVGKYVWYDSFEQSDMDLSLVDHVESLVYFID